MLRIYKVIIKLVALLKAIFDSIAHKDADLARQGRRAAASVALNVAEASGVRGSNRRASADGAGERAGGRGGL